MARRSQAVRLRYLWDTQTIIAIGPRGEVLASEPIARLVVEAPRRKDVLPGQLGHEIDAIREAVIAAAQLVGEPAPEGWAHRLHGKAINTSTPREDLGAQDLGAPRLPKAGPLEEPSGD